MYDNSVNFMGFTPILGNVVASTAGSALMQKVTETDNSSACFIGGGASEEGVVFETIKFAALMNLPLILVIENNYYSVMTKLKERRSPKHDLEKIVTGFGLDYISADGNDILDVFQKAQQAVSIIRDKKNAVVLECFAFRHMAHSAPISDDKIGYREIDSIEERQKCDAVLNFRKHLIDQSVTEEEICVIEDRIRVVVSDSIQFAIDSPFPNKEEIFKDIYHV